MGPLDGIKVVDLSTHVAVPIAGRLLAEWGAEVIKVENPSGDLWRYFGVNYGTPITNENNIIFSVSNANKDFISINLKDENGREVLFRLLEDADIFITNVRGRSLAKMGLDHDSIMKKFPKLCYYYFNGYGEKGAMKDVPGFDIAAFWSACGILKGFAYQGSKPAFPGCGFGDITCGSMIASGCLAAIISAQKTGKGVYATSSLLGTGIWYNYGDVIVTQPQFKETANRPPVYEKCVNPLAWVYECSDGEYVFMGGLDFRTAYERAMKVLGLQDIKDDPKYSDPESIVDGMHNLFPIALEVFKTKPAHEWVRLFTEADIVCQKLLEPETVVNNQQAWDNGYLEDLDYSADGYHIIAPNSPVSFGGMETKKMRQVGGIGANTCKILRKHGFTEEQIKNLIESKAVRALDK